LEERAGRGMILKSQQRLHYLGPKIGDDHVTVQPDDPVMLLTFDGALEG
jgi:hypothetical protein